MSRDPEFDNLSKQVRDASMRRPERFPGPEWTDETWQGQLDYLLRAVYRAGARAQLNKGYNRPDPADRLEWLRDQGLLGEDLKAVLYELARLREKEAALQGSYGVTDSDIHSMISEGFHTAFRKAVDHPFATVIHKLISDLPPEDWSAVIDFVASPLIEMLREAEKKHQHQVEEQ